MREGEKEGGRQAGREGGREGGREENSTFLITGINIDAHILK